MISDGQCAFEAYSEHQSGLTHDGRSIPAWEELTEKIQCAWDAAAMAVAERISER